MILKALEVENYRNIPAARFEPGRELTVICGKKRPRQDKSAGGCVAADRRQKLPRRKGCGTNSRKCRIRRSGGRNAGLWQREPHPRFCGRAAGRAQGAHCARQRRGLRARGQRGGNIHGRCVRPRPPEPREGKSGGTAAFSGCSVMSALSGLCDASAPVFPAGDAKRTPF